MLKKTTVQILIFIFTGVFFTAHFNYPVYAQTSTNPPKFPACRSKIFSANGDRFHLDSGSQQIPGVGTRQGEKNIYTLTKGNFLQCFCPATGDKGIQTNWWNIERSGITELQINKYTTNGWMFFDNASSWDVLAETYLAKNLSFSCKQPKPTPTVTPKPVVQNKSRCVSLSPSTLEGTAPLTVGFVGSGFDANGSIQAYRFNFGDASGGQPKVWEQTGAESTHRYEKPGTYKVILSVKDSKGKWKKGTGDCVKKITVSRRPQVASATTPPILPETGSWVIAAVGFIPVGYYLFKRFKL